MILTFEVKLDNIKTNQNTDYVDHRLFSSKFIVRTLTDTHSRLISLPGPLKWSVMISTMRMIQYTTLLTLPLALRLYITG